MAPISFRRNLLGDWSPSTSVCMRLVPLWFARSLFHSGLLAVSFHFLVRAAQYAEMGSSLPADF